MSPKPSSRASLVLGRAAIGCLIALPAVMAVAHRSSPLLLTLAALFALGATAAEGRLTQLGHDLWARLSTPLGAAILAFLLWGLASAAWSPWPTLSLFGWGEFVLPLAAAFTAASILPARMDRYSVVFLAVAMMLAAALVLADLATGMKAREAMGMRALPFVLNRSVLTLLVLLPAALVLALRERLPWLAAALTLFVVAAILKSSSGAAKLGLLALVVTGALTLLSRRAGLILTGGGLLAALALAPVSGELAARYLPPAAYGRLEAAHAQERVDIWRSFGAALRAQPIAGVGFHATARLDQAPVAQRVAPAQAILLGVGHPHSAALQIWVELGIVGVVLAALIVTLLMRALQLLDPVPCAAVTALIMAALADSMVGQGAWQGWWPAGIGAAAVWFQYGRHTSRVHNGTA
jgi:O-antigen ligase